MKISEKMLYQDLKEMGFEVVKLYDLIDSTNLEAKRLADSFKGNGLLVAKKQVLGKGRRGRVWISPKGGVYMSIIIRPDISPALASMITLLAGLAVTNTIIDLYKVNAAIKWPNDVVIEGKKVAGILTELSSEIDMVNYVVVGIGINTSQHEFPDEIKDTATSLILETQKAINQHEFIIEIIRCFNKYMKQFVVTKNLQFVRDEYQDLCVNIGSDLRIELHKKSCVCKGIGISETGGLLIQKETGDVIEIKTGEASVRGIYGYV